MILATVLSIGSKTVVVCSRFVRMVTERELDREVASATGESLSEIRRLGFSIENSADVLTEPEPNAAPGVIDRDEHYLVELPRRHHRPLRMAA